MLSTFTVWRGHIERAFSDDASTAHDLMSLVVYLSAIANAGSDRTTLLTQAAKHRLSVAEPLRRVNTLVTRLAFSHVTALRRVADSVSPNNVKDLLVRWADATATGLPMADHFQIERLEMIQDYNNDYEKAMEGLRLLMGGYGALQVSLAVVTVIMMIVSLVSPIKLETFQMMIGVMVSILILGVHRMARTAPAETRHVPGFRVGALRFARLGLILLPVGAFVGYQYTYDYGYPGVLVALGLSMLPTGLLAMGADRRLALVDRALPTFLRTLGNYASAQETTLATAVQAADPVILASLGEGGKRLKRRLKVGMNEATSWEMLAVEAGSNLMAQTIAALRDAVKLGTPPRQATGICSEYASQMRTLREKRSMVTGPGVGLILFLHTLMSFITLMMLETVTFFGTQMAILGDQAKYFPANPLGFAPGLMWPAPSALAHYHLLVAVLITMMAVANGLVPRFIRGSHWMTVFLYLGYTLTISGTAMWLAPILIGRLFTFSV